MRYYDELARYEREGFDIIVDRTYEDIHPRDLFDDTQYDIAEICSNIDRGYLDWFMLRVRVMLDGHELAANYLGGMLYEDARECLTDGSAEDIITQTISDAQDSAARLFNKLQEICI